MIADIKRQWLRLKLSIKAFLREWKFNGSDRSDHILSGTPFHIMGLGRLKDPGYYTDDTFNMRPPYYGQPLARTDGHVHVLRYRHVKMGTSTVRYLNTDQSPDGYELFDIDKVVPLNSVPRETPLG